MLEHVQRGRVAGVLTVIARRGAIAHVGAVGMADLEGGRPLRSDAIFRIFSMTKPIVSVAALMLYEEGRFELDDPVSRFLPELSGLRVYGKGQGEWKAPRREMTIRDLLRHTSGLTYGFGQTPVDSMYRSIRSATLRDSRDLVQRLATLPLLFEPGERWEYSRSTDVLGYLVEVVSETPLDQFLEERILAPLCMKDTGFYVPSEQLHRLTELYGNSQGSLRRLNDPRDSRPGRLSGGSGLVSAAADYMRFSQLLLNGGELDGVRLLRPETVKLMVSNQVPAAALPIRSGDRGFDAYLEGYGFGLGVRVLMDPDRRGGVGSVGAYGWSGIANTFVVIDPKEQLVGLLLAQLTPNFQLDREFEDLLYQAVLPGASGNVRR